RRIVLAETDKCMLYLECYTCVNHHMITAVTRGIGNARFCQRCRSYQADVSVFNTASKITVNSAYTR
ncbi:hypothetical protein, partial [Alcanivorax sp. 24]|uniref:hypothetical protein n=1 Tax=Alcanivorax sp. 24 TaxID=2545266 RepID=UPI00196B0215